MADPIMIFSSLIFIIILFLAELLYLRIASGYKIMDNPNDRSSHSTPTARGGGVIFLIPALSMIFFYNGFLITVGIAALIAGAISFADDLKPVNNLTRITVHFAACCVLLY